MTALRIAPKQSWLGLRWRSFALGGCRIRASFLRWRRQVTLAAEGDDRRATLLVGTSALLLGDISVSILLFLLGGSFLCRD